MLKRIITALVAVCVLVPVLIFSGTVVLPIAVAIVTIIGVYEMLKCLGIEKKYYLSIPAYAISAVMPFAMRYMDDFTVAFALGFVLAVAMIVVVFISVIWSHGAFPFADAMAAYILIAYIIIAMNSIIYVRDFDENGKYAYLLIFLGAWMTDIFAYFTGVFLGKHKLIEDVSPKKTVEGSIGGIFFCALSFVLFGVITNIFFYTDANLIFLVISGIIVSFVSQIGDLIMSVIKRHYGIKDYGKIFPGHGGVLDRFDSVLIVSVGLAAICMFAGIVGIDLL